MPGIHEHTEMSSCVEAEVGFDPEEQGARVLLGR